MRCMGLGDLEMFYRYLTKVTRMNVTLCRPGNREDQIFPLCRYPQGLWSTHCKVPVWQEPGQQACLPGLILQEQDHPRVYFHSGAWRRRVHPSLRVTGQFSSFQGRRLQKDIMVNLTYQGNSRLARSSLLSQQKEHIPYPPHRLEIQALHQQMRCRIGM